MNSATGAWVFLVVLLLVVGTAAWGALRAAPWLPTRRRDIRRLLDLAELKPGEHLVDLGAGDARVLTLAASEYRVRATGYEISLLPYLAGLIRILIHPQRKKMRLVFQDFYRVSLADADVVFCFLTPAAMKRLHTKFVHELKPGARVVSYAFSLAGLPGVLAVKPDPRTATAYLYRAGGGKTVDRQ